MSNIKIKGLHYVYSSLSNKQVEALKDINIDISSNETIAVIGQNGSGKTTLMKHLNGLLKASQGTVYVNGIDIKNKETYELSKIVGFAFQNPDDQLFNSSVKNELEFGLKNIGMEKNKANKMIKYVTDMIKLSDMLESNPYDLVYSVRKLVAIACVAAMDTDFIILDEPTTGQDYRGIKLIGNLIKDLKRRGKTIISVTHDMDFAAKNFERTIILYNGEKILDGPTYEVLSKTKLLKSAKILPPPLTLLAQYFNFKKPVYSVESFCNNINEIKQLKRR